MDVGCISKCLISIHWIESIFLKVSAFYARLPRITVTLPEMDLQPVLPIMPFPEGHFGPLAQPMGPGMPTCTLAAVFGAAIRRCPSVHS